jgi:hypothetical protein
MLLLEDGKRMTLLEWWFEMEFGDGLDDVAMDAFGLRDPICLQLY